MSEVKIVLGAAFGDEGKGATVQWLCKKALDEGKRPLVIRFTGGPQSGHTVRYNGITHIFSSFGSGTLLGIPTMYSCDAAIDPICLINEYEILRSKGVKPVIDCISAPIITPYDVEFCRNDPKTRQDGTCGKGVYAMFHRLEVSKDVHKTLLANPEKILECAASYYKVDRNPEYDKQFIGAFNKIKDIPRFHSYDDIDVFIYEGTQGLLLDANKGFIPHVTATATGLDNICKKDLDNAEVYLVTRSYLTRHGNGWDPTYKRDVWCNEKFETNVTNEYQGDFKVGILNLDLLNRACDRHCLDTYKQCKFNLVVTHLDDLGGYPFHYIKNSTHKIVGTFTCSKEQVLNTIILGLRMNFKSVYYSDNPNSDIHLYMSE